MKVGLFGDGPWAQQALRLLLDDPDLNPVFVVGRHGIPCQELYTLAEQSGLPFASPENVNRADFIQWAKGLEADLFVSIHADAFRTRSASGASVYSLSQSGATSEMAAYLAQRENAADLAGGVSLSDRDEDLAEVMLDMQLDWKIEESRLLGVELLSTLETLGPLHSRDVEQAGFAVLKAPAIPSVLVEAGYVTNPSDSKQLQHPEHLDRLAAALFRGILAYCHQRHGCP